MRGLKKVFVSVVIFLLLASPQAATAGTASGVADKTIEVTSKGVYYITKYALKGSWFIIKKTAKGAKAVTVSLFKAGHDAFSNSSPKQPVKNSADYYENNNTLPPPPPVLE